MGKRKSRREPTSIARYVKELEKSGEKDQNSASIHVEELEVEDSVTPLQLRGSETAPKRRKIGLLDARNEKYDATGIVDRYENEFEAPEHLKKCSC